MKASAARCADRLERRDRLVELLARLRVLRGQPERFAADARSRARRARRSREARSIRRSPRPDRCRPSSSRRRAPSSSSSDSGCRLVVRSAVVRDAARAALDQEHADGPRRRALRGRAAASAIGPAGTQSFRPVSRKPVPSRRARVSGVRGSRSGSTSAAVSTASPRRDARQPGLALRRRSRTPRAAERRAPSSRAAAPAPTLRPTCSRIPATSRKPSPAPPCASGTPAASSPASASFAQSARSKRGPPDCSSARSRCGVRVVGQDLARELDRGLLLVGVGEVHALLVPRNRAGGRGRRARSGRAAPRSCRRRR